MQDLSDADKVAMAARNGVSKLQCVAAVAALLACLCLPLLPRVLDPEAAGELNSGLVWMGAVLTALMTVIAREALMRRRLLDPLIRENDRLNRELRELRAEVESLKGS